MSERKHVDLPGPLGTLLQPIIDTGNRSNGRLLHAVECLTRGPAGSDVEQATPLFAMIRERGLEAEMDRVCVAQALRTAAGRNSHRIAVNVHPATLGDPRDFVQFLMREAARHRIASSRLIIEIGEQSPAADERLFRENVERLRVLGAHIAIDDVGFGHANYRSILDCRPEYLKIDRYFVQSVSDDPGRQAVIRSICDLASYFDARVIAEGVERLEDHEVLRSMGIHLFQGFLYGRPAAAVPAQYKSSPRLMPSVAGPSVARG
jgi:EAL domain-containing protein (putative c-di-GMP-specific phosphodiesterase class I)